MAEWILEVGEQPAGWDRQGMSGSRDLKPGSCMRNFPVLHLCYSFTLVGKAWRRKNAQVDFKLGVIGVLISYVSFCPCGTSVADYCERQQKCVVCPGVRAGCGCLMVVNFSENPGPQV